MQTSNPMLSVPTLIVLLQQCERTVLSSARTNKKSVKHKLQAVTDQLHVHTSSIVQLHSKLQQLQVCAQRCCYYANSCLLTYSNCRHNQMPRHVLTLITAMQLDARASGKCHWAPKAAATTAHLPTLFAEVSHLATAPSDFDEDCIPVMTVNSVKV